MSLLQGLPAAEQITAILAPVMGDRDAGTGVAGVLKRLEGIDVFRISASFSADLDQILAANFAAAGAVPTGDALGRFQQAITSLPGSPADLVAPVASKLELLKNLSSSELSAQLLSGVTGLQGIESLIPVNTRDLVAAAADRLARLKGEFVSGTFRELVRWSQSVGELHKEIRPIIASGPGTVEERLIQYLSRKLAELSQLLLSGQESLAIAISARLGAAISADLLSGINAIKADLVNSMNSARIEFQNGNFSNTAHLAAAQASFQQLTGKLGDLVAKLNSVLDLEIAAPEGLARALQKQFDDFLRIEIIDLGNIKDKFAEAIGRLEETIRGLDLNVVREAIDRLFERIDGVIGQFDLSRLTENLSGLKAQIRSVSEAIDGALFEAIAAIRNVFAQIREALRAVASELGSYDEKGEFRFHIQNEIEGFLNGIKSALQEKVRPLLDQLKSIVGQTLQQVHDGLNAVKGEIEKVKLQLQGALQGVKEKLQQFDVAGTMEKLRRQLDGMLSSLGSIDLDLVIDPVVAQINEMSEALKKIDVSALNEFTIGALKVSVEVVVKIDFSAQITGVLMAEFDKLMEIPRNALAEIEARVEAALKRFGELEPSVLLAPLDDLFQPVSARLDALKLETLLEPLDAWYARAQQELDKVSPASLLEPLIALHGQLQSALEAISPAELIGPLRQSVEAVKAETKKINVAGIAAELSEAVARVKRLLDDVSPERLLDPLVKAFDKIMEALDRFNPALLLEPFREIFDALAAPLDNLNAEHARLIGEAFAALEGLLDAFDPRRVFQSVRVKFAAIQELLQQLNVGGLIADLKGPYDAMHASFQAQGGPVNLSLSASVEGLNPLRDPTIGQAASAIQRFQAKLGVLANAEPPAELISRYEEIRPKLESLVPAWARGNVTPASIKRAFQLANPLSLTAEIDQLYEAVKDQLRNLDPRILQEDIEATFDLVKDKIFALDPKAIAGEVQGAIDALMRKLDSVDLQLIADELQGLVGEVEATVAALDPRPIIDRLQGLVEELESLMAALRPSDALAELNAPFQAAKGIVAEFNPAVFREPLQSLFEEIQRILGEIDLGVVLQPLIDRLDDLRDQLEKGLKRAEAAFNGMIAAIPV